MSITRANFNRQFKHVANVRHGVATGPYRVEFDAEVKDVTASRDIVQGSIVSLDANGQYIIGCAAGTGINHPVPFFSMKNVFDPDVTTGIENGEFTTYSAVGGKITAIPATAGYEMETTEFDTDVVEYKVNDGIVPATGSKIGKVTIATEAPFGAEPYIGFVSLPPYGANERGYYGVKRIAIFTNFIPCNGGSSPS